MYFLIAIAMKLPAILYSIKVRDAHFPGDLRVVRDMNANKRYVKRNSTPSHVFLLSYYMESFKRSAKEHLAGQRLPPFVGTATNEWR